MLKELSVSVVKNDSLLKKYLGIKGLHLTNTAKLGWYELYRCNEEIMPGCGLFKEIY